MTRRDEQRPALGREVEALVRRGAGAYAPPPMTAAQRTRFDAGLEQRLRGAASRPASWLVALAAVTAAVFLAIEHGGAPARPASERAALAPIATTASAEDVILAVATPPVAEVDEALPEDYQAISYLVLGQ